MKKGVIHSRMDKMHTYFKKTVFGILPFIEYSLEIASCFYMSFNVTAISLEIMDFCLGGKILCK